MQVEKVAGKNFVTVTRQEALELIRSLTSQLINNNGNSERLESYDDTDTYFSIFVLPRHFKSTREYTQWVADGAQPIKKAM
jgi:hypothetical protein